MARLQTYMQLASEMGGQRYGPFPPAIPVGSDPRRNQLVLHPSHGIYPAHAVIHDLGNGTYTIAPASAECQVFLVPQGQQQTWPLRSAAQARAGDVVIFGTPHGPRFQIQTRKVGRSEIVEEIYRVAEARLMTQTPLREVYKIAHRVRSGALGQPWMIVAAGAALVGTLAAGGASCSGLFYAVWRAVMH